MPPRPSQKNTNPSPLMNAPSITSIPWKPAVTCILMSFVQVTYAQQARNENPNPQPKPETPGLNTHDLTQPSSAAYTTSSEATDDALWLQPIGVTGYIVPHGNDGPADVEELTHQFIQNIGVQNIADVFERLPNADAESGPGKQRYVSLNGLDSNHTLVMVDGMRMVPSAQGAGTQSGSRKLENIGTPGGIGAPDISTIPLSALESTDVIYGGMSSVYGSDALAGAVNFHLKTNYEGAETGGTYRISRNGTNQSWYLWAISGLTHRFNEQSKINFMVTFDYSDSAPYMFGDYAEYRDGDTTRYGYDNRLTVWPGLSKFHTVDGKTYYTRHGSSGQNGFNDLALTPANGFNEYNYLSTGHSLSVSPMISVNYDINPYLNWHGRYSFNESQSIDTKVIGYNSYDPPLIVPPENPYNPLGNSRNPSNPQSIYLDTFDYSGARDPSAHVRTQTYTFATGFNIKKLPNDWFIKADFNYSENQTHQQYNAFPFLRDLIQRGLNGQLPGHMGEYLNPFVDYFTYGDPNGYLMDLAHVDSYRDSRSQAAQFKVQAGGTIVELPAGPLTLGLDLEHYNLKVVDIYSKYIASGEVGPGGYTDFSGSRTVISGAYQIDLPILGNHWSFPGGRALELQFSQRYDQYSDFGSVVKPGFALLYKPFADFSVKASYQESFVAPQFEALYAPALSGVGDPIIDRRYKEGDFRRTPNYELRTMGNPRLKPETGYSYTLTAIWQPGSENPENSWFGFLNGLTVRVAYQDIEDRNIISGLDPQEIVDLAEQDNPFFQNQITRDSDGKIIKIDNPYINAASRHMKNLMFTADYTSKEYAFGKIEIDFNGNYNISDFRQRFSEDQTLNYTNTTPPFKFYLHAFYSKWLPSADQLRTGLMMNYQAGYKGEFYPTTPDRFYRTVASWYTFDWQISYEFGKPESLNSATSTFKIGHAKNGQAFVGNNDEPTLAAPDSWWRNWLGGTKVTFQIFNLFDAQLPRINGIPNRTPVDPWSSGRSFMVQVERKF
jgi:outer membrane receptor protein involved in Fe transport